MAAAATVSDGRRKEREMAVRQMDPPRREAVGFQLPEENPAVPVTAEGWVPGLWSGLPMLAPRVEGCFQNNRAGRGFRPLS